MNPDLTTPEGRRALRKLCDKATPGPWVKGDVTLTKTPSVSTWMVTRTGDPICTGIQSIVRDGVVAQDEDSPDGALIAASRTALPAALDLLDAQTEEIERLRECIDEYAHHRESCAMKNHTCISLEDPYDCICGLDEARGEDEEDCRRRALGATEESDNG